MDNKSCLFYDALEALPNFVVVDVHGNIVYLNDRYARLLGISQKDAIGKHVTKVIPDTRMHEIIKSGIAETGSIMTLYDHENKREVQVVCNRLPLKKDGRIIGAVAVTTFNEFSEIHHLLKEIEDIKRKNEQYRRTIKQLELSPLTHIIGTSPSIMDIKKTIQDFAKSNLTVLLTGETGVGKEVFASALHELSNRKLNNFVKINCAAIPKDLLESELFGYEEGAFTGAKKSGKIGKFELANEGTLLLDEIGEMPLALQSKLLRVLQEKELERVGGTKPVKINVRVICSTNKDVQQLVKEGKFREDLYYRINTVELSIPPLRERRSDIPALCRHFIQKINSESGLNTRGLNADVLDLFSIYPWPGNVRELEHTIERLAFLNPDSCISMEQCGFLIKRMDRLTPVETEHAISSPLPVNGSLHANRDQAEREIILKALQKADGNKTKAAQILGLSRSMLYHKLKKYDI